MTTAKKSIGLFLVLTLLAAIIWPTPQASAASITRFYIMDAGSYLIGGKAYVPIMESDKAFTTSVEYVKYEYSTDNGATWINLPVNEEYRDSGLLWLRSFALPIDKDLVSVKLRVSAYFSPLIGSKSYSEKTIGPYKVLQPIEPSDFTAVPNTDGSVTLTWNDNSNMESYYEITRRGPDGTKVFTVKDTMDRRGKLQYVDKQTNKDKSTFYVYSLTPIVDKYNLPEYLSLGTLNVISKTTVPIKDSDILGVKLTDPIASLGTEYHFLESYAVTVGELYQIGVSGVKLNTSAMTLKKGDSGTLAATVTPSTAANKKLIWSSDNKEVADVDSNGRVVGKAPGTARITVKTENGKFTAVCVVSVSGISDIELAQHSLGSDILVVDPAIIQIDPGKQAEADANQLQKLIIEKEKELNLAKKRNDAEAESAGGTTGSSGGSGITDPIAAAFVYISHEEATMIAGTSKQLEAILAPVDATNQKVSWSSNNPKVADVDSTGNITAKSPGTAIITVRTQDGGFTNNCVVTVTTGLSDIEGHQANSEILLARAQGIVNGYPDETFKPDGKVTRAEFTVMLMNGLQPATEGKELTFKDKNSIGSWAKKQVAQAVELGIISGYSDGTFRPSANITRAEMVTMVMRAYGEETMEMPQISYVDEAEIPNWAQKAANSALLTGIIIVGGKPIDKFAPQVPATRAEAASVIVRMLTIKNN